MDVQPDMLGRTEEYQTIHAADAPTGPHQPVPQNTTAPPLRTLHRLWELITGPEATHWSHLLVRDHLSSSAKLALSHTCKAAKHVVLGATKRASLVVHIRGHPATGSLQAAAKQLATRGKHRTALTLRALDSSYLSYALGLLRTGTAWLDQLTLHTTSYDDKSLTTSALTIAGICCPNVRVLTIFSPANELPSPDLFPKLKQLTIDLSYPVQIPHNPELSHPQLKRTFRTAGPYIKQLTKLAFEGYVTPPAAALPLLLSPGNTGAHLRTLCLKNVTLDDTLLGLVLECALALEDLAVYKIKVQFGKHMHAQPTWRRLQCGHLCLSSLAHLPLPPGLVIEFDMETTPTITIECDTISAEEAGGDRHKDVRFVLRAGLSDNEISIEPGEDFQAGGDLPMRVEEQPLALRAGLALLRSWFGPKVCSKVYVRMVLAGWDMSSGVLRELQGLPRWSLLDLRDDYLIWHPEADAYAPLLGLLPDSIECVMFYAEDRLTREQVESICLGAPANRTAKRPLNIYMTECDPDVVSSVQQLMSLDDYPHVTVE